MITDKRAREIASSWYSGQWTSLYKIVCNEDYSILDVEDWEGADAEARREWQIARLSGRDQDARSLRALMVWIDRQMHLRVAREAKTIISS